MPIINNPDNSANNNLPAAPPSNNPQALAPLHEYQEDAKHFIMTHPRCGLFLDMGLGKACDDDTLIPMPRGRFKRIGDIKPGDRVFGRYGRPVHVTQVFHHKNKTAYQVTLRDGRSFICCDEHLVPYIDNTGTGHVSHKPLGEMLNDYTKIYKDGKRKYKYRIPICDAVQYKKQDHIISPYAMGVLLGAGCLTENTLTILSTDEHVIQKFIQETGLDIDNMHTSKRGFGRSFTHDKTADIIREELNRLYLRRKSSIEKFIPHEYLMDTIKNRKALLAGLLDTDGCLCFSRSNGAGVMNQAFSTMSPRLFADVQSLCHSLGYGVHAATYYEKHDPDKIRNMHIDIYTDEMLMTSPAKLAKKTTAYFDTNRDMYVPIIDISPVEPRDMTCLTVDAPDNLFLINDYIVTHNTRITLSALYDLNPTGHVLVIAPINIARSTWIDEIKKWNMPLRYKSLIVNEKGKKLSRKKRLERYEQVLNEPPTIYFINRDLVADLVENAPVRNGRKIWAFPNIVIDELQSFKNYASQRFKALKAVLPCVTRLIGLTGTPTPKGLMDLWSQIYLMDGGARLGKNITEYRNTYFLPGRRVNNIVVDWIPKWGAEDYIYNAISDLVISMKNTNLVLPPVTYNNINVYMDPDEEKVYKRMMKDMVLEVAPGEKVIAANAAVLSAKLSQMASGALYTDTKHNFIKIHTKKLETCEYIINNTGSPVLIAYHFQSDKAMLLEYLHAAGIDARAFDGSPEMIHDWNAGNIPVMLLQPASAGHGLNLQDGGHTLVWYTIPWSLEEYLQTNARLYRQGQQYPVVIHHLIAYGTIDHKILASIEKKDMSQQALLDAVRFVVEEIDPELELYDDLMSEFWPI